MRDRESFEGKEPFSEHWEEEKKKALAYYIGMQKEGEEFDYCDWSRFEMEIRAEFETAKAEEALPRMVKDAYKEGQHRRIKRRKLASSPYGTSGEDAPMFEGSSNVDEEVIEPAVSTSDCKEPEPGDGNGEDIHSPVFNLSGDVQGSLLLTLVQLIVPTNVLKPTAIQGPWNNKRNLLRVRTFSLTWIVLQPHPTTKSTFLTRISTWNQECLAV